MFRRRANLLLRILFIPGLLVSCSALPAFSATLEFSPGTASVEPGGSLVLDLVVSDLAGNAVAAYDLGIAFDDAQLQLDSVVQTTGLGDPTFFEAFYGSTIGTGFIEISGLSVLSDAVLLLSQGGDSVILATIGFTALTPGDTSIGFAATELTGLVAQPLDVTPIDGQVTIIPEPATALLLAFGLVGIAAVRIRST